VKGLSIYTFFIASVMFYATSSLHAQWVEIPHPGELIPELIAIGPNIYSAGNDTVFRSTDEGVTWSSISDTLSPFFLYYHIAGIFANGVTLIAIAHDTSVLFRTSDDGVHWDTISSSLPINKIRIMAASGSSLFGNVSAPDGGVLHSSDNGSHWSEDTAGLQNASISALATNGPMVFAGTGGQGIFRSSDEGMTWHSVSIGLPPISNVSAIASIGNVLLAGMIGWEYDTADDVFRSTDSGNTWTQSSNGLSTFDSAWDFATSGSKIFASMDQGGVYSSIDSGKSWEAFNWPGRTPLTRYIITNTNNVFVTAYPGQVWRRALTDFSKATVEKNNSLLTSISYSPNPATSLITVQSNIGIRNVTIINIIGQSVVQQSNINRDTFTLDLSILAPGTYFIRCITSNGAIVKTIVKE
jgi:photosystem II stability/assembly factor-like uncharacterized protein